MVIITGHTTYVHRQAGTQNKLTRHTLSLWASSRITAFATPAAAAAHGN